MKFFHLILKQKKITIFTLLFSIILGIIVPQIVFAGCGTGALVGAATGAGTTWWTGIGLIITVPIGAIIGCAGGWAAGSALDKTVKWTAGGVMVAVGSILMSLISGTIALAQSLLDKVLDSKNFFSYTGFDNPVIAVGWSRIRDLANMFIVLGFVVIGIATTLRIESYQMKKTLAPLIIAALLINFSLLICGIFIDASNITVKYFNESGGIARINMIGSIGAQVTAMSEILWNAPDVSSVFAQVIGITINGIITFIILILFAFLFLFRYIALWILVALSPLAFVFYVFPFTKKFFDIWWSNFIGWCIIGIPASFFLYLADEISLKLTDASNGVLVFYVPAFFLIIGFLVSLQSSVMGAGMVIGAFKGTGKFAGSAINKSRLGDAGRGAKNLASRVGGGMLERVGLAPTGTRSKMSASAVDKAHKDKGMDTHTNDEILRQMDSRGATGAAAFKEATKRKILDQYAGGNVNRLAERAGHAEGFGVNISDAQKLNPNLAKSPTKLREIVQKQSPREFAKNISNKAFSPAVLESMDDKQMTHLANSGSRAQKNAMRDLVRNSAKRADIAAHMRTLASGSAERIQLANNIRTARRLF